MSSSLQDLFNLYVFSTGRRMFALRQIKPIATEADHRALLIVVNKALEHDARTLRLETAWQASGYDADPQRVKKIDAKVDRTLTAMRDAAAAQALAAEPGDALYETVHEFMLAIFPAGLQAVTSLPYVEELAAVEMIIKQLKGPFERHVRELGLGRLLERLSSLTVEYRAAQEEKPKSEISFGDVRAARALGQEYLLQVVAVIVGTHFSGTTDHARNRSDSSVPSSSRTKRSANI